MQATTAIDTGILLAVALVLILAAIEDLRTRRISNRLSLALLGLFAARAASGIVAGDGFLDAAIWPVVVGVSVLLVGLALFAMGLMGGGDVKLMASMALFAGPGLGLSFVLYVTVLGGVVALAMVAWGRFRKAQPDGKPQVPYGVAISAGGLWVCFYQIAALSN